MKDGEIRSCGCLFRGAKADQNYVHGYTNTPEHEIYLGAKKRCQDRNCKAFKDYGGRGIEFRFKSIVEFIDHLGKRPSPEHSLDRIDNDGHYEAGNVRWATRSEQARNTRANHWVTLGGETRCLTEWTEMNGLRMGTVQARIQRGWCDACAVTLRPDVQSTRTPRCNHREPYTEGE